MNFVVVGALALLPLSAFLSEAVMWFGRNALDTHRQDEHDAASVELARSAVQSALVSRFMLAVGFVALAVTALRGDSVTATVAVVLLALVWTLFASALSGLRWRSPMSLAGRALFRPLHWLGAALHWVLLGWGRLPGPDVPASSLARVKEMEQETRWLLGPAPDEETGKMLASLHEFGESLVEDVMVPREEIAGIPAEAGLDEILALVQRERHSRYPVYSDSLDTVVGVLHVFDLLGATKGETASTLARKPFFTNDTKGVGALLRELQVTYNQMAVVVDEYGGTAGIITVEDLLEELVGEIGDEHEEEETPLRRLGPGVFWVEGTMRVDEVNEALELDLAEGEYDTLAGLVLDRLERIPRAGERIRADGVWLEVAASEPHRIKAVKVTVPDRSAAPVEERRGTEER